MTEYAETLDWLLEDNYPLTKYNTLLNIIEKDGHDSEVQESLEAMLSTNPVAAILKHQNPDGGFLKKEWLERAESKMRGYNMRYIMAEYYPKYKSTIWQSRFLAEAGVPKEDSRIQLLGNYILEKIYNHERGFMYDDSAIACVNADMVWALLKWGFENDQRVKHAFDIQAKYQRFDDGEWVPPKEWPYFGLKGSCYGANSCITSIQLFLRVLTVVPKSYFTPEALDIKEKAMEFFKKHGVLEREIAKNYSKSLASYRHHRVHPTLEFTSPHIVYTDAIEVITNLLKLGMNVKLLESGINYILSRETENRRWILENTKSSMYSSWGRKGVENKWVTYRVVLMLKHAGKLMI